MTPLDEPLDHLARRRLGGRAAAGLTRLSAGASQEIWRFEVLHDGTSTPYILRRAPGGDRVSESAVGPEVEAKLILAAAAKGVPVPGVPWVLTAEDGLGRGFVMTFVEGETLGGRIVKSPDLADARKILARQCGEIIAKIHTIDPTEFPNLRRATAAELVAQYKDCLLYTSPSPRDS